MRRWLGGLIVISLLVPALAATGEGTQADYWDGFHQGNYSGNLGSLDFSGPWSESGDSGGDGSGSIHVGPENCSSNSCLHIEGPGVVLAPMSVQRSADMGDFETAELSYEIDILPEGILNTTELWVQVHNGSSWVTVKSYDLAVEKHETKVISIDDHLSADFRVRFFIPNVLGGGLLGLNLTYFGYTAVDNVRISGHLSTGPTTTSTSSTTSTTSTTPSGGESPEEPPTSPPRESTTSTSQPIPASGNSPTSTTSTTTSSGGSPASTMPPGEQSPPTSSPATTSTTSQGAPTTTTEDGSTTSTTLAPATPTQAGPPGPPVVQSGLRQPAVGLLADYRPNMMGDMQMDKIDVLGVTLDADFSMAVEVFEAAKVWIAILALMIAAAVVSGMDWKRSKHTRLEGQFKQSKSGRGET